MDRLTVSDWTGYFRYAFPRTDPKREFSDIICGVTMKNKLSFLKEQLT